MTVNDITPEQVSQQVTGYSLVDALLYRRSRRFAKGMALNGGPLKYASTAPTQPLTVSEEAALAFAGTGVTGYALAELPYDAGDVPGAGGGNIMTHFVGRTVASADAIHGVTLFVMNDEGTWMLKRPQDFPRQEIPGMVEAARNHQFTDLYQHSRVQVADYRVDVPRVLPFHFNFNYWSSNVPGTTYFLPVNDISLFILDGLFTMMAEDVGFFVFDDKNGFQPAGLEKFGKSRGGHLHDNPADGMFFTVSTQEMLSAEYIALEQGAILQNLGLMTQALGLGGFPHYAAHPISWLTALGFRTVELSMMGMTIPMPVGLEVNGETLIKPFMPPYYNSMEEAVLAFLDYKYAPGIGTMRDGGEYTSWKNAADVQAGIPTYSDKTVAAVIAYADYIYKTYGTFPSTGAFRTLVGYQAHHLDPEFYDKFYRDDAISDTQRADWNR